MSDKKPEHISDREAVLETKVTEAERHEAQFSTRDKQHTFEQANEINHANDLGPSDHAIQAAQPGESLEQYKARVAQIEANRFEIIGFSDVESHRKLLAELPNDSRLQIASKATDDVQKRLGKQHLEESKPLPDFLQRDWVKQVSEHVPAFKQVISRMKSIPWASEIRVWEGPKPAFPDYSAEYSLLEIDSTSGVKRKAETVAHEGFHATHQDLATLFKAPEPLEKSRFVDVRMMQESGAFLAEIKVNEEYRLAFPKDGNQPVEFLAIDPSDPGGAPVVHVLNDLLVRDSTNKIDDWRSLNKISDFLKTHDGVVMKRGSNEFLRDSQKRLVPHNYIRHYSEAYDDYYVPGYTGNRESMIRKGYIKF